VLEASITGSGIFEGRGCDSVGKKHFYQCVKAIERHAGDGGCNGRDQACQDGIGKGRVVRRVL